MALSATLSLYDEENENQFFNAMLRLLGLLHGPNLSLALHEIRGTDAYQYGPTGVFIRQAMANSPGTSTSTALRRIARAIELCEAWLRAVGDPPCYNVGFLVVCLAAQAPACLGRGSAAWPGSSSAGNFCGGPSSTISGCPTAIPGSPALDRADSLP